MDTVWHKYPAEAPIPFRHYYVATVLYSDIGRADSEIFYQIAYYMGDWQGLDPNEEVIAWTELPENYQRNEFNE